MPLRSELSEKRSHRLTAPLDGSVGFSADRGLDTRYLERAVSCVWDIAAFAGAVGRESSSRIEAGKLSRAAAMAGVMRRRTILDRESCQKTSSLAVNIYRYIHPDEVRCWDEAG